MKEPSVRETSADTAGKHTLHCMEIWGGNHATEAEAMTPGLDIWVHSRPHDAAAGGGDVHYVSLCGGGLITRLIVADLSGHGQTASKSALKLRSLMRRNINRKDQSRLVSALNREFLEYSQLRRFATAIIATYLTTSDTLTISNAGHPRPFWYHANERRWEIVATAENEVAGPANLPLGVDVDTEYSLRGLKLEKDDVVIVYTDALTEALDGSERQLQEAGLFRLLESIDSNRRELLGPELLVRVAEHSGGAAPADDQTLLVLHHNASPRRHLSLGEKLDVYAKVFGLRSV
jgi:serine phosphatase RsbU (regulator of sigma subunit)